jgi:hypothetical protein
MCPPKIVRVPTLGISGLSFGSPGTKWHLDVGPMARHIVYYKGEGGGFPQVRVMMSLMSPCLPVACPSTKSAQTTPNQLIIWFVQVCVNNWCLSFFLVPIPELQHAPIPPKCYEPRSVPQLLTLLLSSPHTHIWVYQGAWERVNIEATIKPLFKNLWSKNFKRQTRMATRLGTTTHEPIEI